MDLPTPNDPTDQRPLTGVPSHFGVLVKSSNSPVKQWGIAIICREPQLEAPAYLCPGSLGRQRLPSKAGFDPLSWWPCFCLTDLCAVLPLLQFIAQTSWSSSLGWAPWTDLAQGRRRGVWDRDITLVPPAKWREGTRVALSAPGFRQVRSHEEILTFTDVFAWRDEG